MEQFKGLLILFFYIYPLASIFQIMLIWDNEYHSKKYKKRATIITISIAVSGFLWVLSEIGVI